MDFTLGVITGVYGVIAIFIFYIVYVIEVKLDLPAVVNGQLNNNNNNNASNNYSRDFSDISQARLRQLIETIIAETLRLPALSSAAVSEVAFDTHSNGVNAMPNGDVVSRHRTEHYFEPKIYQELLATAVLNKIADAHGNAKHFSESSPDLVATDVNKNFQEHRCSSTDSSIEPRSDCSYTDTDQVLNLSKDEHFSLCGSHTNLNADVNTNLQFDAGRESALSDYIASHMVPLPDLSAPATESEEEDYVSITSSQLGDGNWEDNWLFKKRKSSLKTSVTAGGVGMLVPAPTVDVRAQIGDKIADEISDLSEMGSDTDDSSLDLLRGQLDPLNDRLLSKHLIGGHNTKMVLDELIDRTSMISSTSPAENEPIYAETKNEHCLNATTKTEAINTEFTKSLLQDSPPSTYTLNDSCDPVILPPPTCFDDVSNGVAIQENEARCPITGSIAEREYKKWDNAVDMPNNPYAPEALKRRISGSQEKFIDLPNISPSTEQNPISLMKSASKDDLDQSEQIEQERDYKRYSRDYYINDQKSAVTSIKPSTSNDQLSSSQDATDITINEVNANGCDSVQDKRSSKSSKINQNPEYHWTLSTPIRRSSSLKFINDRSHKSHYFTKTLQTTLPPPLPKTLPPRAATSASYYNDSSTQHHEDCYNDEDDNVDVRSHRSWKSATTLAKRRTLSSLSFNSNSSDVHASNKKKSLPSANILSQFEKQLLHKDLKRNSFRAISATTKDFVLNPLFDREDFYGASGGAKLSLKPDADDQGDSGVDSCLNGFSEVDAKNSNNSLLF